MAERGRKQRGDSLKAFSLFFALLRRGCHVYTLHLHAYNVTQLNAISIRSCTERQQSPYVTATLPGKPGASANTPLPLPPHPSPLLLLHNFAKSKLELEVRVSAERVGASHQTFSSDLYHSGSLHSSDSRNALSSFGVRSHVGGRRFLISFYLYIYLFIF